MKDVREMTEAECLDELPGIKPLVEMGARWSWEMAMGFGNIRGLLRERDNKRLVLTQCEDGQWKLLQLTEDRSGVLSRVRVDLWMLAATGPLCILRGLVRQQREAGT